jgi:hypothetical protein
MKITPETHRLLTKLGHKEESYNDIINRIVTHYLECKSKSKSKTRSDVI